MIFSAGDGGFIERRFACISGLQPQRRFCGDRVRPQSVAIVDLEGDGDLDLVVASIGDPTRPGIPNTNAILIYPQQRNQGIAVPCSRRKNRSHWLVTCPSRTSTPRCDGPINVDLAHLNDDDHLDLITAISLGHRHDPTGALRRRISRSTFPSEERPSR